MSLVSIVIPTLNRPHALRRALASAVAQQAGTDVQIEIVVIDNSPDANAQDAVVSTPSSWPLTYVSEPIPGVATVRNAGVRAASGEWIAFLDDDEEAPKDWITSLLRAATENGADAAFGPVHARAEIGSEIGALAPYFSRTINRDDGADISDLAAYLGTNNSMFSRRCIPVGTPFDLALNESGGEDSLLLQRLILAGCRFVWAANAPVTEWAPQKRLNWQYVRRRKFLSGQIRVFVQHMLGPAHWARIPVWMAAGAAQVVIAGTAALLLRPIAPQRAERLTATAYGGLGKVLWAPRFRPALYGSGLVS